jgi:hypothetical protein
MMKKTNKLFLAMCVAGSFALLFGSCKKNEEVKDVNVNLPAFEEEVDGRAYIDFANGSKFMWNANDQIMVYNLDNLEADNTSEKAIFATGAEAQGRQLATFHYQSGDQITAKKYGYFIFYPVSKVAEGPLEEGNVETFTVADTQTYTIDPSSQTPTVDPESMALACEVGSLQETFTLKPIFGNLRLRLIGNGAVTKIEVIDNRYNLSGTVSMKLHEVKMNEFTTLQNMFVGNDDPESMDTWLGAWAAYKNTLGYSANGTGKMVTLNCPEPVELNENEQTQFIIGLRPGALKYGYVIKVYFGDDDFVTFESGSDWHYGIKAGVNKNLVLSVYLPS